MECRGHVEMKILKGTWRFFGSGTWRFFGSEGYGGFVDNTLVTSGNSLFGIVSLINMFVVGSGVAT